MLKILCEKGTKFVSRCLGLLLENFRSILRSFDKLTVTKYRYHMYLKIFIYIFVQRSATDMGFSMFNKISSR